MNTVYATLTHPGNRPGENQDAVGCDPESGLCFVADGMGGHADGALASRIVAQTLLGRAGESELVQLVLGAHEAVMQAAGERTGQEHMGSTVVCVRIADRQGDVVWVGDSRAYLWRSKQLRRLTKDHTYIEVLRQSENLTDEQIRNHPQANVVLQTLGMGTPVPSEVRVPLCRHDWLLLCSDGLWGELDDRQIAAVLEGSGNPEAATQRLVEQTLQGGGRDNVSAVIVEYNGRGSSRIWAWLQGLDSRTLTWMAVLSGAVLAAVVAGIFFGFAQR